MPRLLYELCDFATPGRGPDMIASLNENRSKAQAKSRLYIREKARDNKMSPSERSSRLQIIGKGTTQPFYVGDQRRTSRLPVSKNVMDELNKLKETRHDQYKQKRDAFFKVRDDPNSTETQIAQANLDKAKASDRDDIATNYADRAEDANYANDRSQKYLKHALKKRERKLARREKVKIPRAERRRRHNERLETQKRREQERKDAAREALNSYERQAQEYASNNDDVRGKTLYNGRILSKKEKFDKAWKTPGKKYTMDKQTSSKLALARMSSKARRANKEIERKRAAGSSTPPTDQGTPEEPRPHQDSSPKPNPRQEPASSQPQQNPQAPASNKPKINITGKHVAGASLAAVGVTAAALAGRHIYKKRKERKEKEARAKLRQKYRI